MFEKQDTQQKITHIVAQALNIDAKDIKLESTFEDLGADSLDRLEMIMKFEETFGIDISDDQEAKIKTIAQVVDAINALRTK